LKSGIEFDNKLDVPLPEAAAASDALDALAFFS
jgi:hypothetical protein